MAVHLQQLLAQINEWLRPEQFNDYCPNGLQVEGYPHVRRIVSGVSASAALIDHAIEQRADTILVHHGYFWRGEEQVLTGMKRERLARLLREDINLLAYHLPLDVHPELGNNVQLGHALGIKNIGTADLDPPVIAHGGLRSPLGPEHFCAHVSDVLGRTALLVVGGEHTVRRLAWCTGAGQGYIEQAALLGYDTFLSGEISEQTTHVAREMGIHYIAAGHHATERYGVRALGERIAQTFDVEHSFIDIDNPA